jgi:hypothetical protein
MDSARRLGAIIRGDGWSLTIRAPRGRRWRATGTRVLRPDRGYIQEEHAFMSLTILVRDGLVGRKGRAA